jgi:hypothetical protein
MARKENLKRRLMIPGVVGSFAAGSTVFGTMASSAHGGLDSLFLSLGGLFAASAASATFIWQGRTNSEADRDVILEAALLPVSEWLGKLATEGKDPEVLLERIDQRLVDTMGELTHPTALCTFYRLTDDGESLRNVIASKPAAAHPDTLSEDDKKGEFLISIAKGERDRYVEDLKHDPDSWRISLTDDFRTALFIPIRAGKEALGLLIVEAPEPGSIPTGEGKNKLLAVAHLIGAAQVIKCTGPGEHTLPGQRSPHPTPLNGAVAAPLPGPGNSEINGEGE